MIWALVIIGVLVLAVFVPVLVLHNTGHLTVNAGKVSPWFGENPTSGTAGFLGFLENDGNSSGWTNVIAGAGALIGVGLVIGGLALGRKKYDQGVHEHVKSPHMVTYPLSYKEQIGQFSPKKGYVPPPAPPSSKTGDIERPETMNLPDLEAFKGARIYDRVPELPESEYTDISQLGFENPEQEKSRRRRSAELSGHDPSAEYGVLPPLSDSSPYAQVNDPFEF